MRHPLRLLLIVLAILLAIFVVALFLPTDRPVGPIEQDVTGELVGAQGGG